MRWNFQRELFAFDQDKSMLYSEGNKDDFWERFNGFFNGVFQLVFHRKCKVERDANGERSKINSKVPLIFRH